jgi:hypothetical protein
LLEGLTNKSISRILFLLPSACHLSRTLVTQCLYQSTLRFGRATLQTFAGNTGLFDLSAHEVYLAVVITANPVGSYSTISPLLCCQSGLFSVALSVAKPSRISHLPVRKHDALCCPDFPLSKLLSDKPTYLSTKLLII